MMLSIEHVILFGRPEGVERILDSLVAYRTKRGRPGAVERMYVHEHDISEFTR